MKKSFALILCLVFVISIALVTCVAFIPMNVTQVASAEVNPILSETYYMLSDLSLSELTYFGTYKSNSTNNANMGLPMRRYTSISNNTFTTYNYFSSSCSASDGAYTGVTLNWFVNNPGNTRTTYFSYIAGSYVNTYHFPAEGWYTGNYYYDNSWDQIYQTKNAVDSSFFDNIDCGLYFVNEPSLMYASGTSYQQNVFHVLENMLVNMPVSDAPILDEDSHALLNIAYFYNYINNQYVSIANLQLDAILVQNAVDHYVIDLNNGIIGVPVDITYNKSVGGVSSVVEQSIILSQIESGADNDVTDDLYYLCLCIPAGVVSIDIKFADGTDVLTIDDTTDTYTAFRDNFSALSDTSIDGTYQQGYNAGLEVGAEQADGNNLLSVIWAVFEMPFKLLFGQYDSDANSPTYQQYVGGLFNFYLLGIDLRPFMLSIMSVCIVIGIFRIILGVRGLK